jgi:serine/threonine-protein kinase
VRILLVSSATAGVAGAQAADSATAESLFRSGKERLAQKDFAHACPLFADSFRADPATGTLLAFALCLEGQGKTASAWKAYREVAARSRREGRSDREKLAQTKVAALDPMISYLTIAVPPDARTMEGFEVRRNGALVDSGNWGKPLAVDGGTQAIEASAPGHAKWRISVTISPKQDAKTVEVPDLEEVEPPVATLARPPSPEPTPPPAAPKTSGSSQPPVAPSTDQSEPITTTRISALQGAGVATFVAGLGGLGVGTYFGLRAMSKNKDSKNGCDDNNVCTPQGTQDRWDAHDAGNMSTLGFIGGGVLVVGGAAMYLFARPSRVLAACSGDTCVHAVPTAGRDGAGAVLQGTF